MANSAHGDLAADAAAHLGRGPDPSKFYGVDPAEIQRQLSSLVEWAQSNGVILHETFLDNLRRLPITTAEHEVYFRESDYKAIKITYPDTCGITHAPKGAQRHATPLYYLRRLALMNSVFHSGIEFLGVIFGKSMILFETGLRPSLVVSQPWARAADPRNAVPSEGEIAEFMHSLGFVELKGAHFGWFRENGKITVVDARPDNFVNTAEGVVPIDLVIAEG